ncbi:CaiB/BaiF CoA transferase family protein [Thermodesulfobacteriota bacterium]
MKGALENIKVLELGAWVAAPSAGVVLGDWGAEVIKIEDPVMGDPMRGWTSVRGIEIKDVHFWFELYNRNKKSIGLDLRKEPGREIFYKMIKETDIFLSNFQGPVLENLKLDYQTLSEINPRLIYAVISGYGKKGKDTEKPGYDVTAFWARSGILGKLTPKEGEPPVMPPIGMGDTMVGTIFAGAVSAALYTREKTGEGQELHFSLYHAAVWAAAMDVESVLYTGSHIPQIDREMVPSPLENNYLAKDGKWLQVTMIQSDRFWPDFCKATGIEHLMKDERFKDAPSRTANNRELISILDGIFIKKSCAEWEKIFDEHGLICTTIHVFKDVPEDPQAKENDFFVEVAHPQVEKVKVIASPIQFQKTPASVRVSAPEMGQHTEEILLDMGYEWEEIIAFKDKGAIN